MTRRLASVLLLIVMIIAPMPGPAPLAAGPIAHREVLPNGMILLVAERPAVPIVAVRLFTRGGSLLDPPDRAGLANVVGGLLTRGTAKRSGPELDSAIEFVGGSLGAGAGRDGMQVSLSVLKKDLTLGLDLMGEVVLSPTFPADELTRRITKIRAAIKQSEQDPQGVAGRALARLMFPQHPYGAPVEGTQESVARITRDDVLKFYRDNVRPDTSIVAVVGAVTVDEARREIVARFGGWARPSLSPPAIPSAAGLPPARTESVKRELTQTTMMLGRPAIRQTDPDYFPLGVASYVLGGGSTSRLYTRVREQSGLAYSVYSALAPAKYGASVVVGAQTRTAEVGKVLDLIRAEMSRIGREPVTDHELELAKSYLIGSFPMRLDTSRKVADFLVAIEEQGLGLDYADRYVERIGRVTAADVQRVAARYFAPDAFSQVVVGDVSQ